MYNFVQKSTPVYYPMGLKYREKKVIANGRVELVLNQHIAFPDLDLPGSQTIFELIIELNIELILGIVVHNT